MRNVRCECTLQILTKMFKCIELNNIKRKKSEQLWKLNESDNSLLSSHKLWVWASKYLYIKCAQKKRLVNVSSRYTHIPKSCSFVFLFSLLFNQLSLNLFFKQQQYDCKIKNRWEGAYSKISPGRLKLFGNFNSIKTH